MDADQKVLPLMNRMSTLIVIVLAILLLPIWLPTLLVLLLAWLFWGMLLQATIWLLWLTRGRDTLIVYSDSPHWKEYFETKLIPLVHRRVYVINCSQRKSWKRFTLPQLAFQYFGGSREYCPMIVIFRPFHWARVFRFWKPFQDNKHGKSQKLTSLHRGIAQEFAIPEIPLA